MSTPVDFSLFDHLYIYRGDWAHEFKIEHTEEITCPADAQVQVRFGSNGLMVWFIRDEEVLTELVLKNARLAELSETEIIFEGFERRELMQGVYPFETTVWLTSSKLKTGEA